jgi:TPR repeat protein
VKANPVAAYYWYSMAQRRGHALAGEKLLDLRPRMNAEQIRKADDLLQQHDQAARNRSLQRP